MLHQRSVNTAFEHCSQQQQQQQQRRPSTEAGLQTWPRCRHYLGGKRACTNKRMHRSAALQSCQTGTPLWQQQQQHPLVETCCSSKRAPLCTMHRCLHMHAPSSFEKKCDLLVCCSSAAGSPSEEQPNKQAQQQEQQQQFSRQQQEVHQQHSSRPSSPSAMSHLMHMQPPPQPISVPSMLTWMPPQLLLHFKSLASFLSACWALLPEFVSPSLLEALRRLVLVLGASLLLVVVVSTIDSAWLYMYLLNARRVPLAA